MRLTEAEEVDLFKAFLRLKTMHPNPDLKGCAEWLQRQAREMGLEYSSVEFAPGLPVIILTRRGTEPGLPSVLLNCHMDVVPVVAEKWDALPPGETPFSAWEDASGRIYARGAQDMKCVGAEYLCALRRLGDQRFRRTIHLVWVPDEEIGGPQGMKPFSRSAEFRALNAGVALDEGLAHPENKFVVYYGERTGVWARYRAVGPVGHGSKLIANTAVERVMAAARRLSEIRQENVALLESDPTKRLGDVTTVNITVLQAGTSSDGGKTFAPNVIPSDASITVDVRIAPGQFDLVFGELKQLAIDNELQLDYLGDDEPIPAVINSGATSGEWLEIIRSNLAKWCPVEAAIFPAGTDSGYLRGVGLPAFGFSPLRCIPSLLHDHNEYITRTAYLDGVKVYAELLPCLANS